MPATLAHPGVYVDEVPGGSRAITGVPTSVTAFVGRAQRGPADDPVPISSWAEFERRFGGLWRRSGLGYAVRDFFRNGGGAALVVRVAGAATEAELDVGGLLLRAHGPGAWGNALEVVVQHPAVADAAEVAAAQGVDPDDLFHLTVREGTADEPVAVEQFLNVTVVDGPRLVSRVLASSQLVRVVDPLPGARPAPGTTTVQPPDEGAEGTTLAADDYTGPGFDDDRRGLYALRKADLFNLLVLPPSEPDGEVPEAVWADALALCVTSGALLLVDPPPLTLAADLAAWVAARGLSGTPARNAALYFPRVRQPDPLRGGTSGEFAPSGAVAGAFARTDAGRGVWKAPAGIDVGLVGVSAPVVLLDDAQNGALNPLGLNCLRSFRSAGTVVWGARTLRGADVLADEYKYVPVRRLALFLKESLYRGTQWVVFEPNDEPLWSQVRLTVGGFLQDLFRQGAFQGATPRDAYFVKCDSETTTQYDVDRGVVNVLVGFAPLKPAEFVVISLQQKTATATG